MKKTIFSFCMTLFMAVLMTGCSSDDDEIFGTGLTGKWDLVEVQSLSVRHCHYRTKRKRKDCLQL